MKAENVIQNETEKISISDFFSIAIYFLGTMILCATGARIFPHAGSENFTVPFLYAALMFMGAASCLTTALFNLIAVVRKKD